MKNPFKPLGNYLRPTSCTVGDKPRLAQQQQGSGSNTVDTTETSDTHEFSISTTAADLMSCEFGEELRLATSHRRHNSEMVLVDFVERFGHRDIEYLKETLSDNKHKWRQVTFVDKLDASNNYFRTVFKKDGLRRMIQPIVDEKHIAMKFESKLCLQVETMSKDAIVHVLDEVQNDLDVTSMEITGSMECTAVMRMVTALVGLLSRQDRQWKEVMFHVTPCELTKITWNDQLAMERCTETLRDVADRFQIPIEIKTF